MRAVAAEIGAQKEIGSEAATERQSDASDIPAEPAVPENKGPSKELNCVTPATSSRGNREMLYRVLPLLSAAHLPKMDLGQLPGIVQRQHYSQQKNEQKSGQHPILLNGDSLCFAASVFHLLECVKVVS